MDRVRKLKLALWALLGLAASVAVTRFLFGLGASTNLTDANPWGVWVGFDVMGGVALASGGFIVTATVYIFSTIHATAWTCSSCCRAMYTTMPRRRY